MSALLRSLFVAALLVLPAGAQAANVELAFGTLPSAQGWSYIAAGNTVPETDIFSVVGGTTLHQDSRGVGLAPSGSNRYHYPGVELLPFTLTVRARLIAEEFNNTNHFGFAFGGFTGTQSFGFGLGGNATSGGQLSFQSAVIGGNTIAADAFNFHTYEMRGTPGEVNYDFYIDGTFIQSVPFRAVVFDNVLFLGDATGGQNAAGDVTQFSFTQAALIPEPESYALLLTGLGLLGFAAQRRRIRGQGRNYSGSR
jgi:hypothetical protein